MIAVRLAPPVSGFADQARGLRHVFIRALRLDMPPARQVAIDIDLAVREIDPTDVGDDIGNVVCYEQVANLARRLATRRWPDRNAFARVLAVEILAIEPVVDLCLTFLQEND